MVFLKDVLGSSSDIPTCAPVEPFRFFLEESDISDLMHAMGLPKASLALGTICMDNHGVRGGGLLQAGAGPVG